MVKKKAKEKDQPKTEPSSFEDELVCLEAIVQRLEEGHLGLGESLQQYEDGVKHLKRCYHLLERAEQKIELLLDVDSNGNVRTEQFSEEAMSLEEKAGRRSRGRTRKTPGAGGGRLPDLSGDVDAPGELF